MALEAPAPRLLFRRSAEDRDEIVDRVAATSRRVFFQFLEDDLERPDAFGAQETALPQSAAEQRETEVTLSFGHVLERQTLTRDGSEKPVLTFGIRERVGGLLRLIRGERGEKFLGGAQHVDCRRVGAGECGEDEEAEGGEQEARGETHGASNALEWAGGKLTPGDAPTAMTGPALARCSAWCDDRQAMPVVMPQRVVCPECVQTTFSPSGPALEWAPSPTEGYRTRYPQSL